MNKSKIEWCDYTVNPIKGLCPMHCKTPDGYEYCYAAGEKGLYKRFKWNPEIRFQRLKMTMPVKPSRFFVGSTMELFGDWIKPEWLSEILGIVKFHSQHTFIFLTKKPDNLQKWSPFPTNAWVGVSATDNKSLDVALHYLFDITATVKFISLEPLMGAIDSWAVGLPCEWNRIGWLIVGAQTQPLKLPRPLWVETAIKYANDYCIPVFLKNNLQRLYPSKKLRQEMPE